MEIAGLQKTTLLDYPGLVACTIFLPGCNLRCPFCHNAPLVLPACGPEARISDEELFRFLHKRQGKLDGVCITGGEPTLYPDLPDLLRRIRALGFRTKLDTNGTHPAVLRSLLEEALVDYVAMDIKNSPGRYAETCGGIDCLAAVRESASLLLTGSVDYEFRTTVAHPLHTIQDFTAIGQWLQGARNYYLQQFQDSGHLIGTGLTPFTPEEMNDARQAAARFIPQTTIRGL